MTISTDTFDNYPAIIAESESGKGRIERAALFLFSESTIEGVTTKRIAEEAGVSEGLLYRHFRNKEDLARALMLTIHMRLTQMIANIDGLDVPVEEKVRRIVIEYCHIADTDWPLFRYHILHLHRFAGLTDRPAKSPQGAATSLLEKSMQRGELPSENATLLAGMALGVVLQVAQTKILGALSGPLLPHAGRLTQGVLSVLGLED